MRFILSACVALAVSSSGAAAKDCPDFTIEARYDLSYSEDDLWSERTHSIAAGGSVELWNCSRFDGSGYVARQPDFNMFLTRNNKDRMIRFKVSGDEGCDTVLLINTPSGSWLFNDDDDGIDPVIRVRSAETGRYDIWAGTFGPDICMSTLHIEAFP
ncbi:MAG: hypothetical protein IKG52_13975 [Rhodobacteraceae bacterium]|nr:hypothetical protein [Paracoccaceae bacterium]